MNSLPVLARHLGEGEVAGVPGHLHHRQPRLVGPALHHLGERFVGGRPGPVLQGSGLQVAKQVVLCSYAVAGVHGELLGEVLGTCRRGQ